MECCYIPLKYVDENNISYQFLVNRYKSLRGLEGYETVRLADVAEEITDGTRVKREYLQSGVRIINIGDIKNGSIYPYNIRFIAKEGLEEQDYIKKGDILVTGVGKSGQVVMVPIGLEDSVISSDIIRIRLKNRESAEQLLHFLNSELGQYALESVKSGTLNRISVRDIRELFVPVKFKVQQTNTTLYHGLHRRGKELYDECKSIFEQVIKQENCMFEFPNITYCNKQILNTERLDPQYYMYYESGLYSFIYREQSNIFWQKLSEAVEIKKSIRANMPEDAVVKYVNLSNVDGDLSLIKNNETGVFGELSSRVRYSLQVGELITAKAGSATGTENHITAVVTHEYANMMASDAFYNIVPKNIDPYYLLFLFKQPIILKQLERAAVGLYFRSISREEFENIRIPRLHCELDIAERMREYVGVLQEHYLKDEKEGSL